MSRLSFLITASLCITFVSGAIGPVATFVRAQEDTPVLADTPKTEAEPPKPPSANAADAPEPKPSKPVAEETGAPVSPEENKENQPEEKQKPKAAKRPIVAGPEDKAEDQAADKGKKVDKATAGEPPVVNKLPKLGSFDGPMLPGQPWRVHDIRRPRPPMVTPGELSTFEKPGTAPSDAIVLFDGKDLSNWCHVSSEDPKQLLEPQWKVEDGYFEVVGRTGHLQTIDSFGSCQLHIEWQTPAVVRGDSQGRGNSGIFFMEAFEVQVLDSFDNRTYADGQAGALYGQYPPMVNASRKPGEWQTYDIFFQAPKFTLDGKLESPASITVMHNGIFLHHARTYYGPSGGGVVPSYRQLSPAAPIKLQDHGNPVRYRNVWVRPIAD